MDIENNNTQNQREFDQLLAARSDLAGEGLNAPDVEDETSEEVEYSEVESDDDEFDDEDFSDEDEEDDSDEYDDEESEITSDV